MVNPELKRITIRNTDMPGAMISMVMNYREKDSAALTGIKPGDTIEGTMVMEGGYWLEDINVTASGLEKGYLRISGVGVGPRGPSEEWVLRSSQCIPNSLL